MREIRLSGSEGGGAPITLSLPLSSGARTSGLPAEFELVATDSAFLSVGWRTHCLLCVRPNVLSRRQTPALAIG
jgi:hypothetical protein